MNQEDKSCISESVYDVASLERRISELESQVKALTVCMDVLVTDAVSVDPGVAINQKGEY